MAMTQRSARDLVTDITDATDEGEYDAAVRAAAWGIEAYPDAAVFHRLRGTALVALGANEEAKSDLALALAVDPLDHEALVTLSRLEEAEGDLYTAAEHLLTAWEHDPANGLLRSDLTYRLARLYGSEGYLQYTRPALAALYVRNSYPERAAREYAAALAEQPTRVDLRLASVLARWRLGALMETVDGCALLLEEQPQLVRARWALADALARRGQGEKAREHANYAALLDPDGAIARFMIAGNPEATIVDPDEMVRVSADLPHAGPRVTELHPDEMPAPVPPMAPTYVPSFGATDTIVRTPDADITPASPTFGKSSDAEDGTLFPPEALSDAEDGAMIAPRVTKPVEDEVLAPSPWESVPPAPYPADAPAVAPFAADASDAVVGTTPFFLARGMTDTDAPPVASLAAATEAPERVSDATPTADVAEMPPARDAEPEPIIAVPTETGEILTARPGDEPLLDAADALLRAMNTLEASVEPEMSAIERPIAALPPVPEPAVAAVPALPEEQGIASEPAPPVSALTAIPKPPVEALPPAAVPSAPTVAPVPEAPAVPEPSVSVAPSAPEPTPPVAPAPVAVPPPLPPLSPAPAALGSPSLTDPWAAMRARLDADDAAGAVTLGRAALAAAGKEQDQVRLLLPAMRALVDAAPGRPDTRRLLGDTYRRLGQVAQAQGQYQQALLVRVAGKR